MREAWQNKWQPLPGAVPLPDGQGTTSVLPAALHLHEFVLSQLNVGLCLLTAHGFGLCPCIAHS